MAVKKKDQNLHKVDIVDSALWGAFFATLLLALSLDWYYQSVALPLRVSGWILTACVMLPLGCATEYGHKKLAFLWSSIVELSKVTWASREETIQTTWIVAIFVLLTSMLLWGVDALLSMFVNSLSRLI